MQLAGIILCGGRSSRMGYPKPLLPFGEELLLERTVRIVREAAAPVVVVAAANQETPPLATEVLLACDEQPERGPLEGIRAGLSALPAGVDAAYITSCDVPFLHAGFIARMAELLGVAMIAVPEHDGFKHPLAGVYRVSVLPRVEELLAADRRRPAFLFDEVPTRLVAAGELCDVDPEMWSLRNLNRPDDYFSAMAEAGFVVPKDVRERLESSQQAAGQ